MEITDMVVSVEQGRDLKKLGFPLEIKLLEDMPSNWKGKAFFTGMATCAMLPSLESVQKWLEDKKNISIKISNSTVDYWYTIYYIKPINNLCSYNTYEKALSAGINKAIEILKKNGR